MPGLLPVSNAIMGVPGLQKELELTGAMIERTEIARKNG